MSDISWFNEKRLYIQSRVRDNLLYYQLAGEMSADELIAMAEAVEEMNSVNIEHESTNEDYINEVSQAMATEVVWKRDEEFIDGLIRNAVDFERYVVTLDNLVESENEIVPKLLGMLADAGEDDKLFILTNPLMLSILQCIRDHRIAPVKEGFKGPNNSLKAMTIDGVDVYCFVYGEGPHQHSIIAGWYTPSEEKFTSKVLRLDHEL